MGVVWQAPVANAIRTVAAMAARRVRVTLFAIARRLAVLRCSFN